MLTNLFAGLPAPSAAEAVLELLSRPGLKIERIVSHGHASPPGHWYDEPRGEWVVLLAGEAELRFEDEPGARTLRPGDFLDIAARRRHRVESTARAAPTVWLAVHYGTEDAAS
jgi:cupin 2 domain-containing protein